MNKSFFNVPPKPAVESAADLPTEIAPIDAPVEILPTPEEQVPNEPALVNETEQAAKLLDDKADSMELLATVAEQIPVADEHHAMLTEVAAREIVMGTDIDPGSEVVPSMESAIGGKIDTTRMRGTAIQLRKAAQAVRLGLQPAVESTASTEDYPFNEDGEFYAYSPSTEGIGSDIADAMKKLFSAWKDDPNNRNIWAYDAKEVVEKMKETYANLEWVKMRKLVEGSIALPAKGWSEYLVLPGDVVSVTKPGSLIEIVRKTTEFTQECCDAYRAYKKDLEPIYSQMVKNPPNIVVDVVKGKLAKIKKPIDHMTTRRLDMPADRHLMVAETGSWVEDYDDTDVPASIPAFGSAEDVVALAEELIKAIEIYAKFDGSYPNYWGHDNFSWWDKAHNSLSATDFNFLWRNFRSENVHIMNGMQMAMSRSLYCGLMAINAVEHVLDKAVK